MTSHKVEKQTDKRLRIRVVFKIKFSFNRNDFRRLQRHRAEQTRLQQRITLRPMMPGRERQPAGRTRLTVEQPLRPGFGLKSTPYAVLRQLFIADQPVRPEVRDFDDELVRARFWL